MARKSPLTHKVPLDSIFKTPKGSEDLFYQSGQSSAQPPDLDVSGTGLPPAGTFGPPGPFVIVEQTIQTDATGVGVVTVIIEFPDVPEATGYDFQVSQQEFVD